MQSPPQDVKQFWSDRAARWHPFLGKCRHSCECHRAKRGHRAARSRSPTCYQSAGVVSDRLPQASLMKPGSVKERYMNVSQSLFTLV